MKYLLSFLLFSFTTTFFAQKTDKSVQKIAKEACNCIRYIDINLKKDEKSIEIANCIKNSNDTYQITKGVRNIVTKDSLKTALKEDAQIYKKIENYLYNHCKALKDIYFTENTLYKFSYSNRKKAKKMYDIGQHYFAKEDYKKAIKYFKKAVKKDPKFAFAWDNLGYSYRKINQFSNAIKCYQKSLALDAKGKMPLMNLAVAYQLNNDLINAKKTYQLFQKNYPNDPEAFYGLGRIYYLEKKLEPALENMIQAYILYIKMKSPYYIDAQKHISLIYNDLKKEHKLAIFNKIAKKYQLNVTTN